MGGPPAPTPPTPQRGLRDPLPTRASLRLLYVPFPCDPPKPSAEKCQIQVWGLYDGSVSPPTTPSRAPGHWHTCGGVQVGVTVGTPQCGGGAGSMLYVRTGVSVSVLVRGVAHVGCVRTHAWGRGCTLRGGVHTLGAGIVLVDGDGHVHMRVRAPTVARLTPVLLLQLGVPRRVPGGTRLCHPGPGHVMPCHAMPCWARPCHTIPCQAMHGQCHSVPGEACHGSAPALYPPLAAWARLAAGTN